MENDVPDPIVFSRNRFNLATLHRVQTNDPTLTSLVFNYFYHDDFEEVENLPEEDASAILTRKTIDLTDIDDNFLLEVGPALRNNTFIRELNFGSQRVSSNGWNVIFEVLQSSKTIEKLVLGDQTNFDVASSQLFADMVLFNRDVSTSVCSSLTHLVVSVYEMSIFDLMAIFDALSANPRGCTLTSIDLRYLAYGHSATVDMKIQIAQNFVTILRHEHSKLKELKLSIGSLGDDFVTIFANGIYYTTNLEKLALIGSGYMNTSIGANALASALSHNSTLSELDLSDNPHYGDDGAVAIANAMHPNSQLKTLNISKNGVTSIGAKALADACLHQNGILVNLDLCSNAIADAGTIVIASTLRFNTNLKVLNISGNQITCIGAKALADALYYNRTLLELSLYHNQIADDGVVALGMALRYQPSLEQLHLDQLKDTLLETLKYNVSLKTVHGVTHTAPIPQSIFDYNDTTCDLGYNRDEAIMHLLQENKLGQRSAPKKGLLRKQQVYFWFQDYKG